MTDIVEYVEQKFRSGNSVPIDRAWISADEWAQLRAEIVRLRGEVAATAMLNVVDGWVLEVFRGIDGELGVWARNESNARVWVARTKGVQSE